VSTQLQPCPDCQNPVSPTATSCPNCGRKLKTQQTATGVVAAIIIGLVIGGCPAYLINDYANQKPFMAQEHLTAQLDLSRSELDWFRMAGAARTLDDLVQIGNRSLPVIQALDAEAKAAESPV
jgi:hypothetical protein